MVVKVKWCHIRVTKTIHFTYKYMIESVFTQYRKTYIISVIHLNHFSEGIGPS